MQGVGDFRRFQRRDSGEELDQDRSMPEVRIENHWTGEIFQPTATRDHA